MVTVPCTPRTRKDIKMKLIWALVLCLAVSLAEEISPEKGKETDLKAEESVDILRTGTDSQSNYIPPSQRPPKEWNNYVPPTNNYVSPTNNYVPPTNNYVPPTNNYSPPTNNYIPYAPPVNNFAPPQNDYIPPTNNYIPPVSYVPPQNNYISSQSDYVQPQPTTPSPPVSNYIPPQNDYVAPVNNYAPPQNNYVSPQNNYISNNYTPPQNNYVPHVPPQNDYVPPQNNYYPPQNDWNQQQWNQPSTTPASVIKNEQSIDANGNYKYDYEISDGTKVNEEGYIKNPNTDAASVVKKGSYSYKGADGIIYKVTYWADETGYHATGDHLPTPPPIPPALQAAIDQANKVEAEKNKQQSTTPSYTQQWQQPTTPSYNQWQQPQQPQQTWYPNQQETYPTNQQTYYPQQTNYGK